jgi:hypothetical protein
VRIRDRKLGMLRMVFMLAIFAYIVVYVVWLNQGYLEVDTVVGQVAHSLRWPRDADDKRIPLAPYNFDYCTEYYVYRNLPQPASARNCTVLDAAGLIYPELDDSKFITTRITYETQHGNCLHMRYNDACVKAYTTENTTEVYAVGIEDFTLKVKHSMRAAQFYQETKDSKFTGTSLDMSGKLENDDGDVFMRFSPSGSGNVIELRKLLEATGTDLDALTDHQTSQGETMRHVGIVIMLTISYSNLDGLTEQPKFVMRASRQPRVDGKYIETTLSQDGVHRINRNRHGIKIVFLQTGSVGRFSFQALLIQLVSALGLLSVATLVTEIVMSKCCKFRKEYSQAKFVSTVDFSDYQAGKVAMELHDGAVSRGSTASKYGISAFPSLNTNEQHNNNEGGYGSSDDTKSSSTPMLSEDYLGPRDSNQDRSESVGSEVAESLIAEHLDSFASDD